MHIGFGSGDWDWQQFGGGGWDWSLYGDEIPTSPPTQSGTSAATTHTLDVPFANFAENGVLKLPVDKEQILYVQEKDGRWKLNSKISPIDVPEDWEFKGYLWGPDKEQAYAYFTHRHATGLGARRSRPRGGADRSWYRGHNRPRGGTNQSWYRDHYPA